MKTQNTGIRVETIKEINSNGERGYRITKIEALSCEKLPNLYLKNQKRRPIVIRNIDSLKAVTGHFFEDGNYHQSSDCQSDYMAVDQFWPIAELEKAMKYIAAAGQHLAECNAELAKKRAEWNGKVVFVDGKLVSQSQENLGAPIDLAVKLAKLWGAGQLLYRDDKGQIKKFA